MNVMNEKSGTSLIFRFFTEESKHNCAMFCAIARAAQGTRSVGMPTGYNTSILNTGICILYKHYMVRNEEKYKQAIAFRERGFTYGEIAKICGVSKSTVSNWLKNEQFSKAVRQENTARAVRDNKKRLALVNKARNAERSVRYAEAQKSAATEFRHYKKDPLFMAGIALYVAQGDRTSQSKLRLSHADPATHRLFLTFLSRFLGVAKADVRFWLIVYENQSEVACMKHWSKKTGISPHQFYRTQVIKSTRTRQTLQFGVGNTIIGSTVLKHKLNRWLALAEKQW